MTGKKCPISFKNLRQVCQLITHKLRPSPTTLVNPHCSHLRVLPHQQFWTIDKRPNEVHPRASRMHPKLPAFPTTATIVPSTRRSFPRVLISHWPRPTFHWGCSTIFVFWESRLVPQPGFATDKSQLPTIHEFLFLVELVRLFELSGKNDSRYRLYHWRQQ